MFGQWRIVLVRLFLAPVLGYVAARLQALAGINVATATPAIYVREAARLAGQAALTTFVIYAGLLLVVFVEPPTQWRVAGEAFRGDWRPTWLAAILGLGFLVIIVSTPF